MNLLFLAAGQGSRLRPVTNDIPKAMVPFHGKPLLEHNLETAKQCGIKNFGVVGGYCFDRIQYPELKRFYNSKFDSTNMVTSLFCAKEFFVDDTIISYTDILYHPSILSSLMNSKASVSITIDSDWFSLWKERMDDPLSDAESLVLNEKEEIVEIGKKTQDVGKIQGQYMGLLKFSKSKIHALYEFYQNQKDKEKLSMTEILQRWIEAGEKINTVKTHGGWFEIDTLEDLKLYSTHPRWKNLPDLFEFSQKGNL